MVFHRHPDLLEENVRKDMCLIDWYPNDGGLTTSSGVMFFSNTTASLKTLEKWNKMLLYGNNKYAPDDQDFDTLYLRLNLRPQLNFCVLPFQYLYLDYWEYSHTSDPVLVHPDKSSNWPRVKPKFPPVWWFDGLYHEEGGFMVATDGSCIQYSNLSTFTTGKLLNTDCKSITFTFSYWYPVILSTVNTDFKNGHIYVETAQPEFLGCSKTIFEEISYEGVAEKLPSVVLCAHKCHYPERAFFQISWDGCCRCSDKNPLSDFTKRADIPKDFNLICEENTAMTFKNTFIDTAIDSTPITQSLEHYTFKLISEEPISFSYFKPLVHSDNGQEYEHLSFPNFVKN
jgi:hypothetical protein